MINGQLLALSWGGEVYTITEIQDETLVICCCVGRNVSRYLAHLYHWARCSGCRYIRFHSSRPGLARLGKLYEFDTIGTDEYGQTIYQCEVF